MMAFNMLAHVPLRMGILALLSILAKIEGFVAGPRIGRSMSTPDHSCRAR